jgi:hypothetical protein
MSISRAAYTMVLFLYTSMFVCECAYTSAQDLTSLLGFALKSAKAQLVRDFQGYFLPQSKMRFKF